MTTEKTKTLKDARLEFRVAGNQKALIEDAASLQGISVSDFLAAAAHREAVRIIQEYGRIQLSKAESVRFAEAILNPPQPNQALRALMTPASKSN